MKRTIILTLILLFAAAGSALAELHGSWTASAGESRLHLNIQRGHSHNFGHSFSVSDFAGLSDAQVRATARNPVQFQLVREGGTIVLEGTFRNGDGAGQWTFDGNRDYIAAARALGVPFDLGAGQGDEEADLFTVTVLDLSIAYIRSMQAIGYRETLDQYLSMRIFKVTPELVRELRDLGYRDLSADQLVSMRIHKATPELVQELRKLGYGSLDFDDLISFRIHRVTPQFIQELRELGYDAVDADDLIAMRIHKVTPQYIRELKAAGYSKIPVEKLIEMKIHRIDITRFR